MQDILKQSISPGWGEKSWEIKEKIAQLYFESGSRNKHSYLFLHPGLWSFQPLLTRAAVMQLQPRHAELSAFWFRKTNTDRIVYNLRNVVRDRLQFLHVRHATIWAHIQVFIKSCLGGSNKSYNFIWIPVKCKKQKQTFPSRNTSRKARAGMGCTALSPSFHGNLLLWKLGRWRGKERWGQK